MFSWIVLILGFAASWHYTDIQSEGVFQSMILPVLVGVFLILLLMRIVFLLGPDSGRGGHGGGSSGGGFGGSDGGCGGGDGGGC
ncbi:hypothetical protein CHH28_19435 [Bacterioplanes sanyensis]|uniref:Uncharacterized protein n=1 Tax=Bacterioplanes sanyensis TaxID=1249553 RepID=A0A222FNW6_9GAMM|nr:hypothetical protein [Bacterioplanes sanyensis]ASP40708.1 hypothetical protein CHH28_19435 [Bacterioplanes sanyensis]